VIKFKREVFLQIMYWTFWCIWIAFLRHYIHELNEQTLKNGPVFGRRSRWVRWMFDWLIQVRRHRAVTSRRRFLLAVRHLYSILLVIVRHRRRRAPNTPPTSPAAATSTQNMLTMMMTMMKVQVCRSIKGASDNVSVPNVRVCFTQLYFSPFRTSVAFISFALQ